MNPHPMAPAEAPPALLWVGKWAFQPSGLKVGLICAQRHWGPLRGAQQPSYSQRSSLHGCSPDIDPTWGFLPGAKDFRANGNAPMGTH